MEIILNSTRVNTNTKQRIKIAVLLYYFIISRKY